MKVAIAGGGNVGLFIAHDLAASGHEVLDRQAVETMRKAAAATRRRWIARRGRVMLHCSKGACP